MSETLFEHGGLTVQKYIGPEPSFSIAGEPFSADRRRYQVTRDDGVLITLNRRQWLALAQFFTSDCSSECEGPRIDRPMPSNWRWVDM